VPFATALSEHPDAQRAARDVADRVAEDIGRAPDVALVFLTAPHTQAADAVAATIRERLDPRTLAGVSAVSVVGGRLEIEDRPAVSLWAGRLTGVSPARFTARRQEDGLVVEGPPLEKLTAAHTLILLPDPFTFPVDHLIEQLAARCPDLLVVGGLASASHEPGGNRLILDEEVYGSGAVGLLLSGPTRVTTVVSQGCRPIGAPLIVTKSVGNLIHELAGRSAYQQLLDTLRQLSESDRALAASGLHIGRVVDEHQADFVRGDFLIRAVMGVDPDGGAIAVGDHVPVGATVQFQVRDAASADQDLRLLMGGRAADAALLFTCNGRGMHLFPEPHHDARIVAELLDDVPLGGMFCAGEVGPVGGRSFVHGFTASLALFHED
jgi:small ligand-binding sensory domain FIST